MTAEVYTAMTPFQSLLYYATATIIVCVLIYVVFLFCSTISGIVYLYRRKREAHYKNQILADTYVPVSILISTSNNASTITDTITSLLMLNYSLYEIIVIDNSSSDATVQQILEAFDLHEIRQPIRHQLPCSHEKVVYSSRSHKVPITLIEKDATGTADAFNMGINASQYPYFVCISPDTVMQNEALTKITSPFIAYNNVVAASGLTRPKQGATLEHNTLVDYSFPKAVVPALQTLEFDRAHLTVPVLFNHFNSNFMCPDTFSVFRKQTVIACGGYDYDSEGEDAALIAKVHAYLRSTNASYEIRYVPDALCWSEVPETLDELKTQRSRWCFDLRKTLSQHRSAFANVYYGLGSLLSYIWFIVGRILTPVLLWLGTLIILLAVVFGVFSLGAALALLASLIIFGALMTLAIFFANLRVTHGQLHLSDAARAAALSLVEVSAYQAMLSFVRLKALFRR